MAQVHAYIIIRDEERADCAVCGTALVRGDQAFAVESDTACCREHADVLLCRRLRASIRPAAIDPSPVLARAW